MSISSTQDILNAALKTKVVPNQEYFLQGSVLDSSKDVLLHRLRGLCDNAEQPTETFHDHERVLTLGPVQGQSLTLHARRAVDYSDAPWMLRYIGQPELGDQNRPTMLRNSIDVGCTVNLLEFLTEMGFKQEYEFMCKGFVFLKGRLKVVLYKVLKNSSQLKPTAVPAPAAAAGDSWEPVSQSYLLELSVLAPQGHDAVAADVRTFAEQLRPLVQLEKIDYRRL